MGIRQRLDERKAKRAQREAEEWAAFEQRAAEWAAESSAEFERKWDERLGRPPGWREQKLLEHQARMEAKAAWEAAKWDGYEDRLAAGQSHREFVLERSPALKWIDPELLDALRPGNDLAWRHALNALIEIRDSYRSKDEPQIDSRIESPAEQSLWDAYLSSPEMQQDVDLIPQYTVDHYRLDFADPARLIAIEVDGLEFHKGQDKFIADNQRQRDLQSAGWTVIRFAAKEALDDPDLCLAEIRRMVASQS